MKKAIKLLALFFCVISIAIGTISCESKEQKEARAKAQAEQQKVEAERQRAKEQIKTKEGLLQYLVGKTFAYSDSPDTRWLKVSFLDINAAVVYEAWPSDRNWGDSHRCTIELFEPKDEYGKKTGKFKIILHSSEQFESFMSWHFNPSFYSDFCLSTTLTFSKAGIYRDYRSVDLLQVNANYFPEKWKD